MDKFWKRERAEVKPYSTKEEMLYAIDIILDSCDAIIRRTSGISMDEFLTDDDMMKASAMDMQIIGNHVGRLPAEIRSLSKNLDDAYGFRCRIAHDYGGVRFETGYLWVAVSKDVYDIRKTCIRIRDDLTNDRIKFYNIKSRR